MPSNPQSLATLGYGNGTFVVFDGDSPAVFTSANATTWTRTAINFQPGAAVAYGNGMFVSSALYTSTNGTTWTQQSPLPDVPEINAGAFLSVIYANGAWIATSTAESILIHP